VAYNVYRVIREKLIKSGREAKYFYRTATDVNRHAFEILDSVGNEQFFLWLHYMEPHDPFFADDGTSYARVSTPYPDPSAAATLRSAYQADVGRLDRGLADLMTGLALRGLKDKVTFVFTSDHGEEFAEHGGYYHGVTLYEEMLHVPLFVWGSNITPARRKDVARHIDIAPTILGAFGVEAPTTWEGRDLLAETLAPAHVFAQEDHQGNQLESIRAINPLRHKLILANQNNPRGLPESELFSLTEDPAEKTAFESIETSDALKRILKTGQAAQALGSVESHSAAIDTDAEAELRALGYVE